MKMHLKMPSAKRRPCVRVLICEHIYPNAIHHSSQRNTAFIDYNYSDAGYGIFRLWVINTMPADALAPKVARASAGMVLPV